MTPDDVLTLVLATRNPHKVEEINAILSGLPVRILSFNDLPDLPDVVENGETLEENAAKKAREVADATGRPALADDTGLEVEFLGGAPGVYSARYAGEPPSYERNNRKLLKEMAGASEEDRRAAFRTVVALAVPGGDARLVEGTMDGVILTEPVGEGGFGYDPLFRPDGADKSFAQMTSDEKNAISHRGKAVRAARELVLELLEAARGAA
ncbi:MAG: XTP/dITP diphosphatase [Candidatus Eisenbacteria bacterium]|nr:XTP/dITP diphosphatase [Candidatus Eisenbacteria bacterium]